MKNAQRKRNPVLHIIGNTVEWKVLQQTKKCSVLVTTSQPQITMKLLISAGSQIEDGSPIQAGIPRSLVPIDVKVGGLYQKFNLYKVFWKLLYCRTYTKMRQKNYGTCLRHIGQSIGPSQCRDCQYATIQLPDNNKIPHNFSFSCLYVNQNSSTYSN